MAFDIALGERSNFHQYCAAITSARRTIYIENQYLKVSQIVDCLHGALERGVEVILLMPAEPNVSPQVSPARRAFLNSRAKLATHQNFTLAGIAGLGADGLRKSIYVHSKLMLIDDGWATVGSCNLHHFSLFGNSEINVAFSEPDTVRNFRCELFREDLDQDTLGLDDVSAFQLFRTIAMANRRRFEVGDYAWQGLVFELNLAAYLG
jgi:phosphatidylserine/phosphatidylglycerophosphate/cardiolipin synthase-like enzyme